MMPDNCIASLARDKGYQLILMTQRFSHEAEDIHLSILNMIVFTACQRMAHGKIPQFFIIQHQDTAA